MSKYDKIYSVMIVDDDSRYVEPQKDFAYNEYGLNLVHFKYWDEAQSELTDNFSAFEAIIVDGKGQLSKDSKAEDSAHLNKALNWLKEEKGKGQIIPVFINTGFHEEISKYFNIDEDIVGIYSKGENQTNDLFQAVRLIVEKKSERKVELLYPEIFTMFNEKYLPSEKKALLIQALIACQGKTCSKSDFNAVRGLLESVFIKLKDRGVLDEKYFPGGRINLEWCCRKLSNLEVVTPGGTDPKQPYPICPSHISNLAFSTKVICSIFSHNYNDEYTSNALRSVTFGMMEVLAWLRRFIDTSQA